MEELWMEHLKGFLAGNLFKVDNDVEVFIGEAKYVTPTFLELEIESISESASQLKLEYGNTINERGVVVIFEDCLELDPLPERDLLQVAVPESIELLKSITVLF